MAEAGRLLLAWGSADAIGKAMARRTPSASNCSACASPRRSSRPLAAARRLSAWQTDHAAGRPRAVKAHIPTVSVARLLPVESDHPGNQAGVIAFCAKGSRRRRRTHRDRIRRALRCLRRSSKHRRILSLSKVGTWEPGASLRVSGTAASDAESSSDRCCSCPMHEAANSAVAERGGRVRATVRRRQRSRRSRGRGPRPPG
jgi:hypothetical protein